MNIYNNLPDKKRMLSQAFLPGEHDFLRVNAHMHTPYSFSAFESVQQALDMAVAENVRVVGINDFNTIDGFEVWSEECLKRNLFPLFNIEIIALNREDQTKGIRINDPGNPGRTYLSGKGLAYPQIIKGRSLDKLNRIKTESNRHAEKICAKLNGHLCSCDAPFQINFKDVEENLTLGNVRERHLATALRLKITEFFKNEPDQAAFYESIFGGKSLKNNISNVAGVENEIRSNLLKAGGPAFIPESPESFPDLEDVCRIITDAGGIPTYPFLADDARGNFTGFEEDIVRAVDILKRRGIFSVEFIPGRNTPKALEKYAVYCWDEGLIVTFGSEHNTPQIEPITVRASTGAELSPLLKEISYKGACIVAAHQYLVGTGEMGYLNMKDIRSGDDHDEFIKLGHALIKMITKS
jgi:predicted metal-dependent phosphoesterase TrpH